MYIWGDVYVTDNTCRTMLVVGHCFHMYVRPTDFFRCDHMQQMELEDFQNTPIY